MFSRSPLLIALTLALVVSANPLTVRDAPLVTLPIAKRVNTTSTTSLLKHDQARARGLIARANARLNGKRGPSPDTIVGSTPATDQIVDYVVTEVIYNEDEFFSGTEFTDHISFGSELIVFGQSIGAATESAGFDDSDGVLGLGPTDLTIVNGEVTWGGTDSSKFTGSINFAPITSTSPSNQYWGFNQQIRYGTSTNILSNTAGIVDTGTTLTLIATDALTRYTDANGAVFDDTTGLFQLTLPQFANLQSLFFTINGVTVEFTANAQIWPRALNTAIGGDTDHVYLIIGDIGSDSGSGMDFINGMTWVERFYVVLDTTNQKVGVANTPFTRATTN
ncbi:hypothetical protein EW026_g7181 [Hermanssonia centrifuga]|uniref:Peptidase A1 domain-containing protein n=1 Tax=Hermanssonia centrifuga TaxID=98765 RepID=A0A4S4K8M6_9APHY|nr:hypothetical protein EW026_g7181 [Hermanssonia centrifuga]